MARARWRRRFAFSLAFRLLALIILLVLAVFFISGSDLHDIEPFLAGIVVAGHPRRCVPRHLIETTAHPSGRICDRRRAVRSAWKPPEGNCLLLRPSPLRYR